MSKAETTAQKKNAYNIRIAVDRAIFKEFVVAQGSNVWRGTVVSRFDTPLMSALAMIATKAIMKNPRLDVVLKKK